MATTAKKVPVIKTVNISKKYLLGDVEVDALSGVNIEIYSGEFICFFGPSGCGKSTLLSIVSGLQRPTTGEVYIRGEKILYDKKDELAKYRRNKIGMVFQSFNLITTMNVVENIAMPLAFAGIPKARRMKRAEDLLSVVGLDKYKDHTPAQLSGGQQQRVAIARSMVNAPWIMLADEPTGNLDSKSANDIMRLLISLNRKSRRTVVLITHNPDYLDYADRIFYLQDGKIIKVKVNPKVRKVEEIDTVGKIREDLNPEATDASDEEKAKKLVKAEADSTQVNESDQTETAKETEETKA